MRQLLKSLAEAAGPPGRERAVRDLIWREVRTAADEVWSDATGNLIARKGKPGGARVRIMLAARMDEPALIVRHIDTEGYVRFDAVGRIPAAYLPGASVRFDNGVRGVIGLDADSIGTWQRPVDDLFIDVGASRASDCPVEIGDFAVIGDGFLQVGDRWMGRALSARAGPTLLIETLRSLRSTDHEFYFVFAANTQFDGQGTTTAAAAIDPHIGIVFDMAPAGDGPSTVDGGRALGKGPVILVRDAGAIADASVTRWLERAASTARVRVQRGELVEETSAMGRIQQTGHGAQAGGLALPVRFLHAATEVIDGRDLESAARLLRALVRTRGIPAGDGNA